MADNPLLRHQKLTILQQIDELKNWHKQQQTKLNYSNSSQEIVTPTEDSNKQQPQRGGTENTEITLKTNDKNKNNKASLPNFDDTPVKGVHTNLNALIENNIPLIGNLQLQTNHDVEKPKFRFLRKGEGIARFRMGPVKIKNRKSINKLNLQPINNSKHSDKLIKNNDKLIHKSVEIEQMPPLQPPDLRLDFKNWKSIFSNGNALEIIENAIDNNQLDIFQPNTSIDSSTASIMEKLLVVGRKHLKEKEEMRIFETIEQHVLDSSFSSTSSYVTKLMENAVMSTPEKKRSCEFEESKNIQSNQLCTNVLNQNKVEIDLKNIEGNETNNPPTWTACNKDNSENEPTNDSTDLSLEQSLHVRFNEEIDYKSFVDCSQSTKDNEKNSVEQFDDSEEWKVDCSENSSLCCSQCSSDTDSLDGDVRRGNMPVVTNSCNEDNAKHLRNTKIHEENQVEKLEVRDPSKDNYSSLETKTHSAEEMDLFSPILNAKLKELENEIEAFRSENNKLKILREKLAKERRQFQIDKKRFLNEIEEERKKNTTYLEEEKQKLAKEKFIFEKYSKNLAKKPLKEERKEMQALRDQLNEMKEELNKKESRWGAAQARVRNQVKLLEEDNKKLKEEVEILRKQSKSLQILTQKKNKPFNNTKLIHAINEHISNISPVSDIKNSKESGYFITNTNCNKEMAVEDMDHQNTRNVIVVNEDLKKSSGSPPNETVNKLLQSQKGLINNKTAKQSDACSEPISCDQRENINSRLNGIGDLQSAEFTSKATVHDSPSSVREIINDDGSVEKVFPDGRKEVRLKNGNVKKIDPLSGYVKTIYFNGDVKELTSNGTVKYYFSESRIWHTTFPDGLEVLDFPNGQVEKRYTNGVVEIIYPSNCKKITYPDGLEEIFYADGTNIKIDSSKKKVLSLPNGQKEIHTDECIRREYPDGTVKIVYPDGTTETIYSNGRVRLKDKHGNLVMDSGNTASNKC